jgi:hypothetical protein
MVKSPKNVKSTRKFPRFHRGGFCGRGPPQCGQKLSLGRLCGGCGWWTILWQPMGSVSDFWRIYMVFLFFWMQKPSNNGESIRFNGCWAFNHSSMEFNAFCLINQYINMIWFMDRSFNLSWGYAQFSSQSLMTFWRNETDPWWWLGMPLTRTPPMF